MQGVDGHHQQDTDGLRRHPRGSRLRHNNRYARASTCISLYHGNLLSVISKSFSFFAIVLVAAEFRLKFVLTRFHLLELPVGKFIYCLMYILSQGRFGLVMLDSSGLQLACAIVLVVFGIYHLIFGCVVSGSST